MKQWAKISLLTLLTLSSIDLSAQQADPYLIIDSVRSVLDSVYDYQADIEIEVDVDFIKMPVKHASIYFKKPDKVKFTSDEFIMLPKRGLGDRVTRILEEPYTAIYLGRENISGRSNQVVRIVPMGKNPSVILATWWIDEQTYRITRNTTNTKDEGSFTVDFSYGDERIPLPSEMVFSFEIEKLSLPLKFIGKTQGMEFDKSKMQEVNEGKVYIRFKNYRINTRIPDDLFKEVEADSLSR